jgi:hypothetical protein
MFSSHKIIKKFPGHCDGTSESYLLSAKASADNDAMTT